MALADADLSLKNARELGQATALMFSLTITPMTYILRGEFAAANLLANELATIAEEKGAVLFEAIGIILRGCVCALNGRGAEAVRILPSSLEAFFYLYFLAVDPALQGMGLVSTTLDATLKRIDEMGLPAYLENSNPRNTRLYQRAGFVARKNIAPEGAPPLIPMWRAVS